MAFIFILADHHFYSGWQYFNRFKGFPGISGQVRLHLRSEGLKWRPLLSLHKLDVPSDALEDVPASLADDEPQKHTIKV